jgi:hypothetical protein
VRVVLAPPFRLLIRIGCSALSTRRSAILSAVRAAASAE